MANKDIELAALESRVEALEKRVGRQGKQPVLPFLIEYSNDLGNSLAGNDRILPLLKRLEELETFLDPLFGERDSGDGVGWNVLECQTDNLRRNLELLELVEEKKAVCLGAGLDNTEELKPRLSELTKVQVDQRQLGEEVASNTMDLVQKYNEIIASISEAFVQADIMVTKAEQEKSKVKISNE